MTMANLIKRIAVSSSSKVGGNRARITSETDSANRSGSGQKPSIMRGSHGRRSSLMELSNFGIKSMPDREAAARVVSFKPTGDQIKVTKDIRIKSESIEGGILGPAKENIQVKGLELEEMGVGRRAFCRKQPNRGAEAL